MAPRKKNSKNPKTALGSSKHGQIKPYTRKKHIGNLRALARNRPVRFESRKQSVLSMLESKNRNPSPDEINMRLRGCRNGTPFRSVSPPNDGESDQTEVNESRNVEEMLNQIVELQLTAARLQGKSSLSKIVHKALDYGIQNGIIINGAGPPRDEAQWSKESSQSTISVSSQRSKDSRTNNVASASAWGGRSLFRIGQLLRKLLTYLRHPIKKSTVSKEISTQYSLCDVNVTLSDHLNSYGANRMQGTKVVNDMFKAPEPVLTSYRSGWNTCSEKCSTHASIDTNAAISSSACSDNSSYRISSCSGSSERPVNVNVNIQADYMRPNPSPVMGNNHPIVPNQCLNSNLMEDYDLFNFEQCMNAANEKESM